MRILLDLDSTLNDLAHFWLTVYNKEYNDKLTPGDILSWDTHKYVKPECGKKIYDYLTEPNFFFQLEPLNGAQEFVSKLQNDGHEAYIVTACEMKNLGGIIQDKIEWLQEYIPSVDKKHFITTHHKYLVNGDVLVDDGPHNAEAYRQHHPNALIMSIAYPYNRTNPAYDFVVDGWDDTANAFDKMYHLIWAAEELKKVRALV